MRKIFFVCSLFFLSLAVASTPELHVCTVASKEIKELSQLKASCAFYSVNIDVLGIGLPYKGNGQKLTYLQKYLESVPDSDLVLFVDGYDCLILANTQTVVDRFLEMGSQCVISAEACWCPASHAYLKDKTPKSPTKFKYLNSGSFMGYAGYLKSLLASISPIDESKSDQGQLQVYYSTHQKEIILDVFCELFITLQNVEYSELALDIPNKKVHSLTTRTTPFVIHGNGEGKGLYQNIYDKLFK